MTPVYNVTIFKLWGKCRVNSYVDKKVYYFKTLGKQDVNSYDNELLEAPEEEGEFDVLNDETFGNIDDGQCFILSFL